MDGVATFFAPLLSPSLLLQIVYLLVPPAITLSGALAVGGRRPGARMIAFWGFVLTLWLVLPVDLPGPELQQLGQMISILGWCGLVLAWGRGLFRDGIDPLWAQVVVGMLLTGVLIGIARALIFAP